MSHYSIKFPHPDYDVGIATGREKERQRIREAVQEAYDHVGKRRVSTSDDISDFDAGRITALRQVLNLLDWPEREVMCDE